MARVFFAPESTRTGELPPWEQAKAIAFHTVIADIADHLGTSASDLLGRRVDEYICSELVSKGGGEITPRTLRNVLIRCKDPEWYPGRGFCGRKNAGRLPFPQRPSEGRGGQGRHGLETQASCADQFGRQVWVRLRSLRVHNVQQDLATCHDRRPSDPA